MLSVLHRSLEWIYGHRADLMQWMAVLLWLVACILVMVVGVFNLLLLVGVFPACLHLCWAAYIIVDDDGDN